jgi:hypothetical protein
MTTIVITVAGGAMAGIATTTSTMFTTIIIAMPGGGLDQLPIGDPAIAPHGGRVNGPGVMVTELVVGVIGPMTCSPTAPTFTIDLEWRTGWPTRLRSGPRAQSGRSCAPRSRRLQPKGVPQGRADRRPLR